MMKLKSAAVFAAAVGVFLTGAAYRFHDSAHAIGRLSVRGGEINHPVLLDDEKSLYTIIVTGIVVPPYRGDARVTLEGDCSMNYQIHNSEPVIDLGFFRHPRFLENTFYDLREKDKVAVWVVLRRKERNEAPRGESETAAFYNADLGCCDVQQVSSQRGSDSRVAENSRQRLVIAFRDIRTGKPILSVPIIFRGREETTHGTK